MDDPFRYWKFDNWYYKYFCNDDPKIKNNK